MTGTSRRAVSGAASAVLFAIASWMSPALGRESSGRVVVLEPADSSPQVRRCLTRVAGELTAGGFAVAVVDPGPGADPVSLAFAMRDQTEATAVVALVDETASGPSELWVLERVGRQPEVHRITAPAGDPEHLPEVLAIRTIEVLRASALKMLVESNGVRAATRPPPDQGPSAAAAGETGSTPGRLGVESGLSLLESVHGPGPAVLPLIRLRGEVGGPLFIRLGVAGLGTRPVANAEPVGSATVNQAFGVVEVGVAFRRGHSLRPQITLGAGALYVDEVGRGMPPFQGSEASRWSALTAAGTGLSARLGTRLTLAAEAHVLLAFPFPTIRFENMTAATVGRPAFLGSLALVTSL